MASETTSKGVSGGGAAGTMHFERLLSDGVNRWWALPNTAFGMPMGLAGVSILWNVIATQPFTEAALGKPGMWFFWVAACATLFLACAAFLVKAVLVRWYIQAEWCHHRRVYFFFMPHLTVTMLALAVPPSITEAMRPARTAAFLVCFLAQTTLASLIYGRWMFNEIGGDVGHAEPPYLLSTVGWPLLANLAHALDLQRRFKMHLSTYLFGCGAVFYGLAFISIMQGLHAKGAIKGQPELFLLIAPPAVSSVTLAHLNGGFSGPSQAVFGFCVLMLIVLLRIGPRLADAPSTLGTYWAYVFPPAALASAAILAAREEDSRAARSLAWILIGVSMTATTLVFFRSSLHQLRVMQGAEVWSDPVLAAVARSRLWEPSDRENKPSMKELEDSFTRKKDAPKVEEA